VSETLGSLGQCQGLSLLATALHNSTPPPTNAQASGAARSLLLTVLLHRSSSSWLRGISSLLTGTMAVLLGSTRSWLVPSVDPFFVSACRIGGCGTQRH
jgi:hypothetical protein